MTMEDRYRLAVEVICEVVRDHGRHATALDGLEVREQLEVLQVLGLVSDRLKHMSVETMMAVFGE